MAENLIAPSLRSFAGDRVPTGAARWIDYRTAESREYLHRHARPSAEGDATCPAGNQQKALVAEWIGIQPEVIIFDEPTRGVDVGARAEIYQKLEGIRLRRVGIVMISSDLPELIGVADRILVMHHGKISGELERGEFSEERILFYAAGLNDSSRASERNVMGTHG